MKKCYTGIGNAMSSEGEIREVKRRHSAELLRLPGVCGVGVEKNRRGEFILRLHLDTDDPKIAEQLPREIEGYAVESVHSGPFRKQAS